MKNDKHCFKVIKNSCLAKQNLIKSLSGLQVLFCFLILLGRESPDLRSTGLWASVRKANLEEPRQTCLNAHRYTDTHAGTCKSTWGREALVCGHSPGAGPPWWRSAAWPTARSAFSAAGRHISCSPSPGAWRPPLKASGVWAAALSLPPPPHHRTRRSCSWRQSHCLQEPRERTRPCAVTGCGGHLLTPLQASLLWGPGAVKG